MFLLNTFRTIKLALKSLLLHKLRSGLTMLGIVFGVFSVVAMLAIGEGASSQAQKQVMALGATNILVVSVKPPAEAASSGGGRGGGNRGMEPLRYGLLRSDFQLLTETIPTLAGAVPIREIVSEVRYLKNTASARIVASTSDYLEMNHLKMRRGRFLSEEDNRDLANVAVISSDLADSLYPQLDPIDRSIQIRQFRYRIIGITQPRSASAAVGGSLSGQDYSKDVYVPIRTFQARIGDRVFTSMNGSFSAEQVELNQITIKVRDRSQVIPTAEVIRESLEKSHGLKKDIDVIVPLELLRQADQIRYIFNIVLGAIAAISLVVGGIGIMNIMLATVTERTREIGIRRALGARQTDITQQFLVETIVLSGAGGVIGILMGLLTPAAFRVIQQVIQPFIAGPSAASSDIAKMLGEMQPEVAMWSLPVAFGISVGIGVVFGLYPARAAARMDPIEALRHE